MERIYEVFDPRDGLPLLTTRAAWLAEACAKAWGMDWNEAGRGW